MIFEKVVFEVEVEKWNLKVEVVKLHIGFIRRSVNILYIYMIAGTYLTTNVALSSQKDHIC